MKGETTTMKLRINTELLADAKRCARAVNAELERFCEEVIESYVAERRMWQTIPKDVQ